MTLDEFDQQSSGRVEDHPASDDEDEAGDGQGDGAATSSGSATVANTTTNNTSGGSSQYWRKWEECQDRHEHDEKKQRIEEQEQEDLFFALYGGGDQQEGNDDDSNHQDVDAAAAEELFARHAPLKVVHGATLSGTDIDNRADDHENVDDADHQFLLPPLYESSLNENNQKLLDSNNDSSFVTLNSLAVKMPQLEKVPVTGLRQSPIDIKSCMQSVHNQHEQQQQQSQQSAEDPTAVIPPLSIDYSPVRGAAGLSIENTGNGWKLNIPDEVGAQCPITGGPLGADEYRLLQVHSHWGKDSSCGSEHTLDGRAFPSEIHLVHWNATKYADPTEAMECSSDGLAVVGVFVNFSPESEPPNPTLDVVCKSLPQIPFCGDCVPLGTATDSDSLEDLDLNSLIVHRTEGPKYWSYAGSLTTPPFCESVIWIVMEQAVEAQEEQIAQFRQINQNACTSDEIIPLVENFREAQPLHSRNVDYYN